MILIDTWVDGHGPFKFLLDTGASRTGLSARAAAQIGLVMDGFADGEGVGGPFQARVGLIETIRVGSAEICDVHVFVIDLTVLEDKLGVQLDGILGFSFLRRFRVTIDYPAGLLKLEKQ